MPLTELPCRRTRCRLSMYFLFVAGRCLWTAAVLHPGPISWLSLTSTRSWPTTAACCKSITTRASSKVTSVVQRGRPLP